MLRYLSTLVFQGFETGPEEWLKCLKKKGESVDEMTVSESEFMASVKVSVYPLENRTYNGDSLR